MPGPYFQGQQPSECGHYYPDVLRLRDEKKQDGTFVRVIDCAYCGRYELPLDIQSLDASLRHKLQKNGIDIGVREGEVAQARQKNLNRLIKDANELLS